MCIRWRSSGMLLGPPRVRCPGDRSDARLARPLGGQRGTLFYVALFEALGLLTIQALSAVDAVDIAMLEVQAGVGHLAQVFRTSSIGDAL